VDAAGRRGERLRLRAPEGEASLGASPAEMSSGRFPAKRAVYAEHRED